MTLFMAVAMTDTDWGSERLESRMIGNGHVRFGGGPLEKGRIIKHLAGGLPYGAT